MVKQRIIYTKNATNNEDNGLYVLLFHHNISNGDLFVSERDFLFANTKHKYSLFGYLDDSFKYDRTNFGFLLEYPDDDSFCFFTQKVNPWKAEHDTDVDFLDKGNNFKGTKKLSGLTRSATGSTYVDGSKGDIWYHAIGQRAKWESKYVIPGSYSSTSNCITYKEVFLWLRIPNISFLRTKNFGAISCRIIRRSSTHAHAFTLILIISYMK